MRHLSTERNDIKLICENHLFICVNLCFIRGLNNGDRVMSFHHKEVSEAIIGAAFEVHSALGYGFSERVYQNSLQVELIERGHRCETESQI